MKSLLERYLCCSRKKLKRLAEKSRNQEFKVMSFFRFSGKRQVEWRTYINMKELMVNFFQNQPLFGPPSQRVT